MAKSLIKETIYSEKVRTVRLADGTKTASAANVYSDAEVGKAVKLSAESRYVLCAAGDLIEGFITSVDAGATYDDYTVGGFVATGYKEVTFDGSQAAGTGAIAVGDYVVAGTISAKGTALPGPVKVRKATIQPGVTEATVVGDVNDQIKAAMFAWRVVSLGTVGTGAVGTTGIIERVSV